MGRKFALLGLAVLVFTVGESNGKLRCCGGSFYCSNPKDEKCIAGSKRCNYDNDCGNSQDEQSCNEHCYTKTTNWNSDGGGNAVYLDRHRVNCGSHRNVLKSFRLQRLGHHKIRYQYVCCKLLTKVGTHRLIHNPYTIDGHGNTVYLDRQRISCGRNGILNDFWLSRNSRHDHWRFNYYCLNPSSHYKKKMTCYRAYSRFTYDGRGRNIYLDRQHVSCRKRYFLTYLRLVRNSSGNHIRYAYRCCHIKST